MERAVGHDPPAGGRRTGEGDHVHHRVGGHLVAHVAVAGDHVEHPGRDAGLFGRLGDQEGVERRPRVGLEHHGAAGGQGRGDLHHVEHEREVERRDGTHHADGLTEQGCPAMPFGPAVGAPASTHSTHVLDLVRVRTEHPDRAAGLDVVGEEADRARLGHDQLAQLGGVGLEDLGHPDRARPPARPASCNGHGPSSKALRAASMARTASLGDASGTVPMTSSVAGLMTSMDPGRLSAGPGPVDVEVEIPALGHGCPFVSAPMSGAIILGHSAQNVSGSKRGMKYSPCCSKITRSAIPMYGSSRVTVDDVARHSQPPCSASSTMPIMYGTGTSGFQALWLTV